MHLNVELGDLQNVADGRPSLFYGYFLAEHGREPTAEDIEAAKTKVKQELQKVMNG